MQDALLYMVYRATDPAKVSTMKTDRASAFSREEALTTTFQHDADMLEATMAGAGTKDEALVRRITMIHWSRDRLHQCKAAYKHFYKRDLADRIKGETRGDLETLLVAMVNV
jgi:annexin A7/11